MTQWWWAIPAVVATAAASYMLFKHFGGPSREEREAEEFERARRAFHRERERTEAKFLEMASTSGRPRGLRWKDCEFDDGVAYARDKQTAELRAFVAVTVSFEAIEGGGMEDVEAVGNLRGDRRVLLPRVSLDHGRPGHLQSQSVAGDRPFSRQPRAGGRRGVTPRSFGKRHDRGKPQTHARFAGFAAAPSFADRRNHFARSR
ncbi:MAG: hypothetical protein QM775_23340 [Pirellulales bacterium]